MNGAHHFIQSLLGFQRHHGFGNQIGGARPDDLAAHDALGFVIDDDFHKAAMFASRRRFAVGTKPKLTDAHFQTFSFGLRARQANAGNFGMGVITAWNVRQIDRNRVLRHDFRDHRAFAARQMRPADVANAIANRVNAAHIGFAIFVDQNLAVVVLDANVVHAQIARVGTAPSRHQHTSSTRALFLAVLFVNHVQAIGRFFDALQFGVGDDFQSDVFENAAHFAPDVFVFLRHDLRSAF